MYNENQSIWYVSNPIKFTTHCYIHTYLLNKDLPIFVMKKGTMLQIFKLTPDYSHIPAITHHRDEFLIMINHPYGITGLRAITFRVQEFENLLDTKSIISIQKWEEVAEKHPSKFP